MDKPKGIDVVKQGIQKLKFDQQIRKSESGEKAAKTPKMELTINVDGVTIQDPKTKKMMHKYPLHKISYCADDKAEKRFFSFIAKEGDTANHTCFVFVSDKLVSRPTSASSLNVRAKVDLLTCGVCQQQVHFMVSS